MSSKTTRGKKSSIQSGVSGPLFDGATEPAPPSPQRCLVLQPLLSLSPFLCGLGILDHFSMAGGTQAQKRRTWDAGTTLRKPTSALRRVQNSPPGTNIVGPAPPLAGPIHRTIVPDLMQSVHPCNITPLTP